MGHPKIKTYHTKLLIISSGFLERRYRAQNRRIKKFIFRFICIPAKWIKHARIKQLRIYGNIAFKT